MTTKKIKTSDILGDNYYIYELTSSNYTPVLNGAITITCTMKDVYGAAASGKSITLYQNGTSKGVQTTNSNGIATWSITCSTAGLQKFNIKDTSIEVFVDNKEDISNKVTSLDSFSTDTEYPSAKAVYDEIWTDLYGTIQSEYYVQSNDLGVVAFSNDYNDLDNLPQFGNLAFENDVDLSGHDLDELSDNTNLLFSGDYDDLTNKPTIPTATSDLTNDSGFLTSHQSLDSKTVTVEKLATATSGYLSSYVVKQNGIQVGNTINIPKDFLVKSGSVKTVSTANNPVSGYSVGDKYIDLVINVQEGTSTDSHIYILVSDLIDTPVTISDVTGLQTALNGKEDKANKVTSISSSSTDTQYPSAKCVYDELETIDKAGVENFYIDSTTDELVLQTTTDLTNSVIDVSLNSNSNNAISNNAVTTALANIINYELVSSDYNPNIDDTITLTCTCTNYAGQPIANKQLTLYHNGSSVSTATTNNNGIASWNIICTKFGIRDYNVANVHCQIKVGGWKTSFSNYDTYDVNSQNWYTIVKFNETTVTVVYHSGISETVPTALTAYSTEILQDWQRPSLPVTSVEYITNMLYVIRDNANVMQRRSLTGASFSVSSSRYIQMQWEHEGLPSTYK